MKEPMPPLPPEGLKIRCPRLGHQIGFSYCRMENNGSPCFKALTCWAEQFLVEEYMKSELDGDEWERCFRSPPKQKMISLLELIEQAKQRKRQKTGDE